MSFKNIRIYIIFVILSLSYKKISIVCYNMKMKNIPIILIIIKIILIKIKISKNYCS